MGFENKKLGFTGENIVAQFLEKNGYKIVAKNFSSKFGEIDIIAEKYEFLVFVEVKTRKICYFPISSVVTPSKQKKIIKTAKYFLMKKNINIFDKVCRFDVATLLYGSGRHEHDHFQIDYIENAFWEQGR